MNVEFLENLKFDFIEFLPFRSRPFKAKFIPSKIFEELDRYKNDSKGLVNYSKKWKTKVVFKNLNRGIMLGGEYYDKQITLEIFTKSFDDYKFTDKRWISFKYKYLQVMMHELIHFMQYNRRDEEFSTYYFPYKKSKSKKRDEVREYLSCFDEVQAYAHCLFFDANFYYSNSNLSVIKKKSGIFKYYRKNFGENSQAINKLLSEYKKWQSKYKNSNSIIKRRKRCLRSKDM